MLPSLFVCILGEERKEKPIYCKVQKQKHLKIRIKIKMLCKFWDVHLTHICAKDRAACSEEGWLFHCRAGLPPCSTGVSLRSSQRFCVSMQLVHPTFPACQGSRGRAAYVGEKQLYFNLSPGECWVRYHPTLET